MFKRILFAATREQTLDVAADYVADLARTHGAEVLVFCVAEVPEETYGISKKMTSDKRRANEEHEVAEKVAKWSEAEALVHGLIGEGIKAYSEVAVGRPAKEVLAAAVRFEADLIVIGAPQRSALTALLTGSVAAEVVRKADRPVLCIPYPMAGEDAAEPS